MTIATFGLPQKLNYVISIGLKPAERVVFLVFIALNRDLVDSQDMRAVVGWIMQRTLRRNLPESKDIM
jgi:hypothetical protein